MTVGPGTRIGPYQVSALIGEGGMGKVWRAHHTALRRDDALKVLPDAFAADRDRVARFKQEAQVLAALNHPHIAHVYGLEETDGAQALVMELVEGPTLADRIVEGPMRLDEALVIARQIADALSAAHEQGIVHRDLKPSNVKVRSDGTVKVLDFGLAKAMEPAADSASLSMSPTVTSPAMTQSGVILGTAAYMSPEQARGQTVDKRTDIWAFGVVLFEMLTGKRPFDGRDVAETIASVIKEEPQWKRAPLEVQRLLRKCLEKDPRKRLHDFGDIDLLLDETPSETGTTNRSAWVVAGALMVGLIVAAAGWWRASRPVESGPLPLVRLDVDLGPDVSLGSTSGADVVISPDGSRIAYTSKQRLYTRPLDQPQASELAGTEGAYSPFFSPDGRWIAFFSGAELKRVSVDGGAAIVVSSSTPGINRGGSWGDDGTFVFASSTTNVLMHVSERSPSSFLTSLDAQLGESTHRWPQLLPQGKGVLFTAHTGQSGFDDASIEVFTLPDRRRKTLHRGGTFGRYIATPSGASYLTYVRSGTLYAAAFDLERLEVRGTPMPVLQGIASSTTGSAQVDVSGNGTLVFRRGASSGDLVNVQWIDNTGKTEPIRLAESDC